MGSLFILNGTGTIQFFSPENKKKIQENKTDDHLILNSEKNIQLSKSNKIDFPELKFGVLNISFDSSNTDISSEYKPKLDSLAKKLLFYKNLVIEIGGYTDAKGDFVKNEHLSLIRAEKVKAYLISKGVAEENLVTFGYGELFPIYDNANNTISSKNRRIEIKTLYFRNSRSERVPF